MFTYSVSSQHGRNHKKNQIKKWILRIISYLAQIIDKNVGTKRPTNSIDMSIWISRGNNCHYFTHIS